MITHVKFATIPVTDQDRALAFYTEKLGFEVVGDHPFDGQQRWIELRPPGAQTQLVLFTAHGHEKLIGTFSNVTFATGDVRQTCAELTRRGVEFTQPPTEQPWGVYAVFKDPDGNRFVLSTDK